MSTRNRQGVLSMDKAARGETVWLRCCWDDCERQAVQLHRTFFHDHNPTRRCDDAGSKHLWYTFCSERHRAYFLNSHRSNGNLATGDKGLIS